MKYIPLFDNVLVKEIDIDDGIIAYQDDQFGRVIAAEVISVGPGNPKTATETFAPQLSEGDVVYFNLRNAKTLTLDGREFFVINEHDILVKEING